MRAEALTVAVLLLSLALAPVAAADGGNPIRARIGAPADGGAFTRGEPVAFVDATTTSADCPIVNWTWKFDDAGKMGYGERVVHVYRESREYRPSLHVLGACGHKHGVTITLDVRNAPPIAALDAPSSPTAGEPFVLDAAASRDPDGTIAEYRLTLNDEPLPASASPRWTLNLTTAGAHRARLVVVDDDGSESAPVERKVEVSPAALSAISLAGPTTLHAGQEASYRVSGRDAYGNDAPLATQAIAYRAPERAGVHSVAYTEQGVTGALDVEVVPAALARLELDGPAEAAAGSTVVFDVRAFDAYGNPREPAQPRLEHVASTRVGDESVCHREGEVDGCAILHVVAGPLASLVLDGPREVVVAQSAAFSLAGFDRHGNPVTLANDTLSWTAPVRAGPARVAHEEGGVAGSLDVLVLAGPLARIELDGPSHVAVGTSTDYALRGFDAYGNDVALSRADLRLDAPETPQQLLLGHEEQGVRGERVVEVVPGPLARLHLSPPASVVAGDTAAIALRGEDRYGNDVPLANESFLYAAPTRAGDAVACHTEDGVTGCAPLAIIAGPLARIALAGPATLAAGDEAEYALRGQDRHGNDVALERSALLVRAPTTAGIHTVTYEEQMVVGELMVRIVAGPLARIDITGPATLAAGASATYRLAGGDQYANEVPLERASLEFRAPTQTGPAHVRYAEAGIEGEALVEVVPAPLARLALDAPAQAVVGEEISIGLAGWDAYDNVVELSPASFVWRAPSRAGPADASYAIGAVRANATILLLPDALARIEVAGPAEVRAGEVATFAANGSDRHGNAVPLASSTFDWRAPDVPGASQACTSEAGVTGCAPVEVVPRVARVVVVVSSEVTNVGRPVLVAAAAYDEQDAPVPKARFTWSVAGGTLEDGAVSSDRAGTVHVLATSSGVSGAAAISVRTFLLVGAQLEEDPTLMSSLARGIRGNVSVSYLDGGRVANATVSIVVTRLGVEGALWPREEKEVVTDAQGRANFTAALPSGLPGDYRVELDARAGPNAGGAVLLYTVRA